MAIPRNADESIDARPGTTAVWPDATGPADGTDGTLHEPWRRYERDGEPPPRPTQKRWLRTPIFGPAVYVCFDCHEAAVVGWFAAVTRCLHCGGERFTLPHHVRVDTTTDDG